MKSIKHEFQALEDDVDSNLIIFLLSGREMYIINHGKVEVCVKK